MSGLVFLDTETTGLDPDRHEVWEVAAIYKQGDRWIEWEAHLPVDLTRADPTGLRIGRFYERRGVLTPRPDNVAVVSRERWKRDEAWLTMPAKDIAQTLAVILDGNHIVGAVPSFDAAFLSRWLNAHGQAATWHYHLIDVEALAAGWLIGTFAAIQEVGKNPEADGPTQQEAMRALPPWNSNKLSAAIGVNPEDFDRHTAMGDALWAKAIYERVMGPA